MIELLATWLVVIAVTALPTAATWLWLQERGVRDLNLLVIVPLLLSGLLGYATFFAFLLSPFIGKVFSLSVGFVLPAFILLVIARARTPLDRDPWSILLSWMAGCGLLYLCLLYLPGFNHPPEYQSAFRFNDGLPEDAVIPKTLADRLYSARPIKPFIIDWLSSDRPPLQTGMYLQVRSCLAVLPLNEGLVYQCIGTWAQLFWIPAIWLVCRALELTPLRTAWVLGLIACTGFTLLNSTYVWPKLLAGAYGLLAGLLLLDERTRQSPRQVILAALAAALAWLSHGGVAFSLIALAILLPFLPGAFGRWRLAALGFAVFIVCAGPWIAYQKYYDPPGNRLLKWHLAGVQYLDPRPFGQTLREAYTHLNGTTWSENKIASVRKVFGGDFTSLVDFAHTPVKPRRIDEFFHVFRALGVLNFGWLLLPFLFSRGGSPARALLSRLMVWMPLSLIAWIVLMFEPASTVIHQSSYTMMLAALVFTSAAIATAHRAIAGLLTAWHCTYFLATWPLYFGSAPLRFDLLSGILIGITFILIATAKWLQNQASSPPLLESGN